MRFFKKQERISFNQLEEGETASLETTSNKGGYSNKEKIAIGCFSLVSAFTFIIICTFLYFYLTVKQPFNQFIATYDKHYGFFEFYYRAQVFYNNQKYINNHNLKDSTYKLEMNKFGDLTASEFASKYLNYKTGEKPQGEEMSHSKFIEKLKDMEIYSKLPISSFSVDTHDSFDWRKFGAITPIKNQGHCGSCWAFSAIASVESAYHIAYNKTVDLAEEELVSCMGRDGCRGGKMTSALEYVAKHGIHYEKDLPYNHEYHPGACKNLKPSDFPKVKPLSFSVWSGKTFRKYLETVPLSVGVCASDKWRFYKTGIFTDGCIFINHGVQAIAHNKEGSMLYYTIKNSWGADWGEDGFIRLGTTSDHFWGPSGLYLDVSSAVINKSSD